jgi:hypothetical protein
LILLLGSLSAPGNKKDKNDTTAAKEINDFPLFLKLNPVIFYNLLFDFFQFQFKLRKKSEFSEIFRKNFPMFLLLFLGRFLL